MSLSVAGVWQVGVWAETVWADGVWREGQPSNPEGYLTAEITINSVYTATITTSPCFDFNVTVSNILEIS